MSAATRVEIANMALLRIGQRTIASFEESSVEATLAKRWYDRTRKTVLASAPWRFAVKNAELAVLSDAESGKYLYAYALPSDLIRALYLCDQTGAELPVEYEVVGNQIWTDDDTGQLRYVWDQTDPNRFDVLFIDVLAYKLAAELATGITGRTDLAASMLQAYVALLPSAKSASAGAARKPQNLGQSLKDSRA